MRTESKATGMVASTIKKVLGLHAPPSPPRGWNGLKGSWDVKMRKT